MKFGIIPKKFPKSIEKQNFKLIVYCYFQKKLEINSLNGNSIDYFNKLLSLCLEKN